MPRRCERRRCRRRASYRLHGCQSALLRFTLACRSGVSRTDCQGRSSSSFGVPGLSRMCDGRTHHVTRFPFLWPVEFCYRVSGFSELLTEPCRSVLTWRNLLLMDFCQAEQSSEEASRIQPKRGCCAAGRCSWTVSARTSGRGIRSCSVLCPDHSVFCRTF